MGCFIKKPVTIDYLVKRLSAGIWSSGSGAVTKKSSYKADSKIPVVSYFWQSWIIITISNYVIYIP
jgi:hypothetical protein